MRPRNKFLLGSALIVGCVALLMVEGLKQFGQYSFNPSELAARVAADSSFYNVGLKLEAKVVPGSVRRDVASQTIDFQVSDGAHSIPVTYRGLAPDTFTDATGHRGHRRGPPGAGRGVPRHRRARQVRLALRGQVPEGPSQGMTLLGQFALWVAAAGRTLGRGDRVLRSLAGPSRAGSERRPLGLRRLRPAWWWRRSALWKGLITHDFNIEYVSSYTSPEPSRLLHLLGLLGRPEGLAAVLGHWCSRSSPAWPSGSLRARLPLA